MPRVICGQRKSSAPDCVVSGFGAWACLRTKEWNYVRPWTGDARGVARGREELYDLNADPQELNSVAPANPSVCKDLAAKLEAHIRRHRPLTTGSFQRTQVPDAELTFDALPPLHV